MSESENEEKPKKDPKYAEDLVMTPIDMRAIKREDSDTKPEMEEGETLPEEFLDVQEIIIAKGPSSHYRSDFK